MKKTPTGFIAICQCGTPIGAMDYQRTPRQQAGQMLGQWLADGCTVQPQFADNFSISLGNCTCATTEKN